MRIHPTTCHGEEARREFATCINSFLQDDATGKAYGVRRDNQRYLQMVPFAGCGFQSIVEDFETDVERLNCYETIVIDSGNAHGDSWIATFYPKQMVLTFVDQTAVHGTDTINCISCGGSPDLGFRNGQCNACAGHSEDNAVAPSAEEVRRNQMECLVSIPGLPVLELRYNNAAVKSICPVCKDSFKPSIGEWEFLVGTWSPVCDECSGRIVQKQASLDSDAQDKDCPF